ncbi:MAG: bifunctional phosphopantothenoylcysteine decarboxylase/phosphopantothenate--cysteine ligase CoaBC [Patescibacteria group bacterium]|nr:bifunctional phosphopantothenoylcysteine decarboxylase/phosphopantothenate--cysteine ligase CoaBC [Patescibacteria group bacterium]
MIKKQNVIIGVTGGIAAYKAVQLVQGLKQKGIDVYVVLTRSAKNFVSERQLEKVSGHKVYCDLFESDFDYQKILQERRIEHIELADKADLVLVVPATANFLGKLAHGLADDFLTTTILATKAPVMICPAMNASMWQHPAVIDNLKRLKNLGYQIINPVVGMLACGYEGLGRLEDLEKIVTKAGDRLRLRESLKNKKILVTAGATRELIDDVRFITNSSSGKMGQALAQAAERRSAKVKLLMGQKDFNTAQDLLGLIKKYAVNYEVIFHVAAVGDFEIESRPGKLSSRAPVNLELKSQIKILEQIKKINSKIMVVGFKAEYGLPKKLVVQPGADVTIYNDVSRRDIGFAVDDNEVVMVMLKKQLLIRKAPKTVIAEKILDYLTRHNYW